MSHRIAFYGTLLSVHGAQDHLGIRERCRFITACRLPGLLYDFGPYPALVAGEGSVYGEIFEVDEETLRIIDEFEGAAPGGRGADYVRTLTRPLDREEPVWVYHHTGSLEGAALIESGDYRTGNSAW